MKKRYYVLIILLCLFAFTSCGKSNKYEPKDDASAKELLEQYMAGVLEANTKKLVATMPEFIRDKYMSIYNDGALQDYRDTLKQAYGDNLKGSVKIEEEIEAEGEELQGILDLISEVKDFIKPSKCYIINGSFHLEGSKESDDLPFDGSVARCNFDGKWRILLG